MGRRGREGLVVAPRRLPSFVRLLTLLIAWRVAIGPLWDLVWARVLALLERLARRLDGRLRLGRPLRGARWAIPPQLGARAEPAPPPPEQPSLTSREAGVPLEMQADIGAIRAHLRGTRAGARHAMHFELGPLVRLQTEALEGCGELVWDEAFRVSLSASATALRGWSLTVSCVELGASGARLVGRASISLWACATGPRSHDHELRAPDEQHAPVGRVAFRLAFGEHRAWAARIEKLRFSIPLESIALDQLLGAGQEPGTAAAAGGTSWLRARRQLALDRRQRSTCLSYRLSQKQLVADTLFVSPVPKELHLETVAGPEGGAEPVKQPEAAAGAVGGAGVAPAPPARAGLAAAGAGSARAQGAEAGASGALLRERAASWAGREPGALGADRPARALLSMSPRKLTAPPSIGGVCGGGSARGRASGSPARLAGADRPAAADAQPQPPAVLTRAGGSSARAVSPVLPGAPSLPSPAAGAAAATGTTAGVGAGGNAAALDEGGGGQWHVVAEWEGSELPAITSFGYFEELLYGTVRLQLTADSDAAGRRRADGGSVEGGASGGGADGGGGAPSAAGGAGAGREAAASLSAAALPVDLSMEQRFKTGRQSALCWVRLEQLYNRSTPARACSASVGASAGGNSRGSSSAASSGAALDGAACTRGVSCAASDDGADACGGGGGLALSAGAQAGGAGAGDAESDGGGESAPDLVAPFSEYLWVKGVRAGRVSGSLRFVSPPLFSQLLTGTLSEGGVVRQVCTVIMPRAAASSARGRRELEAGGGGVLRGPSSALSSLWSSLVSSSGGAELSAFDSTEPQELLLLTERLMAQMAAGGPGCADAQLSATFDQIDALLASSHKESLVSFVYASSGRLHEMQALLLSFALRLLDAVPVTRYSMRARCYGSLLLLLRRGELNQLVLDQLGPGGHGLPAEIIRLLVTLLYRLLAMALNGLHHGDMLEEQPSFRAAVIGICYFRVPRFADPLIEALAEPSASDLPAATSTGTLPTCASAGAPTTAAGAQDIRSACAVAIPEWRGLVFDLESDPSDRSERSALDAHALRPSEALRHHTAESAPDQAAAHRPARAARAASLASVFDWSPLHEAAERVLSAGELAVLRALVPPVAAWRSRLRAAGTPLFCSIFEQWVREVASSSIDLDESQWHTVPGYRPLLKRFLLELKAQHVMHYPEAMLRLALVLLQHTHLHSVLTRIVLLKTSLHDVGGVSVALDLVGVWVGTLKHVNMPMIRSAFDFEFLFDAIRVLLEGEQMQVLLKTIEFLYTGFDLLLEEQADVLRRVVRPFFVKLFCHWSPNVRRFFHHLLIFRLVRPIGWTRVVQQLPTYRVLPAAESTPALAAAAGGGAASAGPPAARSPRHSRGGEHGRVAAPSPGPACASCARCLRAAALSGELGSAPSCAAAARSSSGQQLAAPAALDGEGGDVVSWYEQAVDDMRSGRLGRVPPEVRCYVPPSVRALDALCEQHAAVLQMAVSSGEPLLIPTLHWDTLLLDNEAY